MVCALHDSSLHEDHQEEMLKAPEKDGKTNVTTDYDIEIEEGKTFSQQVNLRIMLIVPTELRCKANKLCFKRPRSDWCSPRCP